MPKNIQKEIKLARRRNFLAKDFDSFRAQLLDFARTYFPNKIKDFSEASVGGLFLDLAAMVGDSLSFYLDHQFNELNALTAIETDNIIMHLRNAGVPIVTASPAVVTIIVSIDVPSETTILSEIRPQRKVLPVIEAGTTFLSNNEITFNLIDDLNFSKTNSADKLLATSEILEVDGTGNPTKYRLSMSGICISGVEKEDNVIIPNSHVPFREIILAEPNVTDIISVRDTQGDIYYEVGSLTQDVVFGGTPTVDKDFEVVEQNMEIIPAPRRFIKIIDPKSKITTLQFGSGNAETLDDDMIPDPSDMALPLYGKKTFSRFTIDPNSLLGTQSLGISPTNTTLLIKYRFGGGLSHNVSPESIRTIETLFVSFRNKPTGEQADAVRQSMTVNNLVPAVGGLPSPSLEDLRAAIPASRQMQSRIVSKSDALARIYTLPSRFGRVFRAAITPNPSNPLSSNMHVICKNQDDQLTIASDPLKKNMRKYLNEFRLISDAVDILDARILNFGVEFSIVSHPNANKRFVVQLVINRLKKILIVDNFQINQPIVLSDIINIIINTDGVISLVNLPRILCFYGDIDDRNYSAVTFTPNNFEVRGLFVPPPGSIFELRYPDFDIIGNSG